MLERKCAYFKGGGGEGEWKQASARKRVNSEDKYREYGISFIDQIALEYLWTLWGFLFDPVQEAEDIKKKWQEYTKELYKKDLHDPDNHDGMITHLEPDILECEVKWALKVEVLVTQSCPTLCNPWTIFPASLSMVFSRQEYWSELPFSSPEDLPDPGIEPRSPALQVVSLLVEQPGEIVGFRKHW